MREAIEVSCMLGHSQVDNLARVPQDLSSPGRVHREEEKKDDL